MPGQGSRLKQSSLFDLSGVVVVEQLQRDVLRLRDESVQDDEKVCILRRLAGKRPATQVIIDTGAGRTVRRLSRDRQSSRAVTREADRVLRLWMAEVDRREERAMRGPMEVRCDLETEAKREAARCRLREAFKEEEDSSSLPERIEKEVFDRCGHLLSVRYKWYIAKLEAKLKERETRRRLKDREDDGLTVRKLVANLTKK